MNVSQAPRIHPTVREKPGPAGLAGTIERGYSWQTRLTTGP